MPRASWLIVVLCLAGLGVVAGVPAREPSARPAATPGEAGPAGERPHAHGATAVDAFGSGPRDAALADAFRAGLRDAARVCKPAGPWGAQLEARGVGADGSVLIDVVLRPHLPHDGLRWELALPAGSRVVAGRADGEVHGEPGDEHRVPLAVVLPSGLDAGSVRLDVTPLADARLATSREIDFGAPPEVGASQHAVLETGASSVVAVLPSVTREGR